MTEKELFESVTQRFDRELPPLVKAIFEEACEHVIAAKEIPDEDKVSWVFVTFKTTLPILQATLNAGFEYADTITLNYRGQPFLVNPDDFLLKLEPKTD
jgi:hypothetical protein